MRFAWIVLSVLLVIIVVSVLLHLYSGEKPLDEIEETIYHKEDWYWRGELITFNKQQIDLSPGQEDSFFMGIQNPNPDTKCYLVLFRMMARLSMSEQAVHYENIAVGGKYPPGYDGVSDTEESWFHVENPIQIGGRNVSVISFGLRAPEINDTYLIELDVFQTESGDCSAPTWSPQVWQKKQFYLGVS
jgi:hypothetical protein